MSSPICFASETCCELTLQNFWIYLSVISPNPLSVSCWGATAASDEVSGCLDLDCWGELVVALACLSWKKRSAWSVMVPMKTLI